MADNIANLMSPSSIRLAVEPVEVELETADGSLLFTALQSAFPQSTGIYFRPKGAECRVMLKFDGRRFMAPNGGWNNSTEYFVELSGSRHTPFPFGSYEHASKQFERSVNLVQQMMNGGKLLAGSRKSRMGSGAKNIDGDSDGRREELLPSPQPIAAIQHQQQENGEMEELREPMVEANSRKASTARKSSGGLTDLTLTSCSAREAKSLERDFADLARICAGKDAVIDGQRMELDATKKELDRLKGTEKEWAEREAEWSAKWEAAEQELAMLRALGRDQQGLHGQIEELGGKLEEERAAWGRAKASLEMEMRKWEREAQEWKEKSELGAWTANELTEQLKKTQREKSELQRKTAILEEQVNGEAMEFSRRFQEREKIQQELLADNTRLYQIKDQLEVQCKEMREKLDNADVAFEKKMATICKEFQANDEKLRENLALSDSRTAQLEAKIEQLAKEKAQAEEHIRKLQSHTNVGNSEPLFAYSQG